MRLESTRDGETEGTGAIFTIHSGGGETRINIPVSEFILWKRNISSSVTGRDGESVYFYV